jgi:hypothetical protein
MVRHFLLLWSVLLVTALFAQPNPAPFLNIPLVPESAAPGSPGFTLTLNGTGFVSGATATWNGSPRPTKFVSASQLTAQISAADVAKSGTASVAVQNPGQGEGSSNIVYFPIRKALTSVSFAPHRQIVPSTNANVIATGDFNGDGNLDLVIANFDGINDYVDVYLGNGKGGFAAPIRSTGSPDTCCGPVSLLVADFNADGIPDIAISTFNGDGNDPTFGYVMSGNGDGTFSPTEQGFQVCTAAAAGDVNGDSFQDLITTCVSSEGDFVDAYVYLSDGKTSFTQSQRLANVGGAGAALGDFNGDGKLDLALAGTEPLGGTAGVWVALGNGDGTFETPVQYSTQNKSNVVYAADVNGDGKLDLVTDGICTLYGNGDGTFTPGPCTGTDLSGHRTAFGDFDGDGTLDVVIAGFMEPDFAIYPGKPDGTFGSPLIYSVPGGPFNSYMAAMPVGDFMNDGGLDFVASLQPETILFVQTVASVSPTTLNFGTRQETKSVTLTNALGRALELGKFEIKESKPGAFRIVGNNCGTALPGGGSCEVQIRFTPAGSLSGYLIVNYQANGSPQIVPLSGLD